MTEIRVEEDMLGSVELPREALYGIHSVRAQRNFTIAERMVNPALIHAYGAVKLASLRANNSIKKFSSDAYEAIETACEEMISGSLDEHIIVDALQGGAGTSTNMNVNEVLANRALVVMGKRPGDYKIIDPLEDINRHQSTNDTYPTALKVAAIVGIRSLAQKVTQLQEAFQRQEHRLHDVVKVGRTQMQDAVLTTLGREMSAYAECLSRDRWRVFKCEERLRVVNLGGTAIGTGVGAPREYIFRVVDYLREIVGFGLSRGENLVDATQNVDAFVEVSGILKTLAVNLQKISHDLRFLSSGPEAGIGEIVLPQLQAGSSIMPGKVNPVIPEAVIQASLKVVANDHLISSAAALGNMELNAFMPLIADALLDTIGLLGNACTSLAQLCVDGIEARLLQCDAHVQGSTASLTAFVDVLGYNTLKDVAEEVQRTGESVKTVLLRRNLCSEEEYYQKISPESVMRIGSRRLG